MTFTIRFAPSAQVDLKKAKSFYSQSDPALGQYCTDSLMLDIERLRFFAGTHLKIQKNFRMVARTFPYSIYYQVRGEQVLIIAVLDNRRDPEGVLQRLSST